MFDPGPDPEDDEEPGRGLDRGAPSDGGETGFREMMTRNARAVLDRAARVRAEGGSSSGRAGAPQDGRSFWRRWFGQNANAEEMALAELRRMSQSIMGPNAGLAWVGLTEASLGMAKARQEGPRRPMVDAQELCQYGAMAMRVNSDFNPPRLSIVVGALVAFNAMWLQGHPVWEIRVTKQFVAAEEALTAGVLLLNERCREEGFRRVVAELRRYLDLLGLPCARVVAEDEHLPAMDDLDQAVAAYDSSRGNRAGTSKIPVRDFVGASVPLRQKSAWCRGMGIVGRDQEHMQAAVDEAERMGSPARMWAALEGGFHLERGSRIHRQLRKMLRTQRPDQVGLMDRILQDSGPDWSYMAVLMVEGDLLDEVDLETQLGEPVSVGHQANCVSDYAAGVAAALMEHHTWCEWYTRRRSGAVEDTPGTCHVMPHLRQEGAGPPTRMSTLHVVHLFGRRVPGGPTVLETWNMRKAWMTTALKEAKMKLKAMRAPRMLCVPEKMGCDMAGGSWPEMLRLLAALNAENRRADDVWIVVVRLRSTCRRPGCRNLCFRAGGALGALPHREVAVAEPGGTTTEEFPEDFYVFRASPFNATKKELCAADQPWPAELNEQIAAMDDRYPGFSRAMFGVVHVASVRGGEWELQWIQAGGTPVQDRSMSTTLWLLLALWRSGDHRRNLMVFHVNRRDVVNLSGGTQAGGCVPGQHGPDFAEHEQMLRGLALTLEARGGAAPFLNVADYQGQVWDSMRALWGYSVDGEPEEGRWGHRLGEVILDRAERYQYRAQQRYKTGSWIRSYTLSAASTARFAEKAQASLGLCGDHLWEDEKKIRIEVLEQAHRFWDMMDEQRPPGPPPPGPPPRPRRRPPPPPGSDGAGSSTDQAGPTGGPDAGAPAPAENEPGNMETDAMIEEGVRAMAVRVNDVREHGEMVLERMMFRMLPAIQTRLVVPPEGLPPLTEEENENVRTYMEQLLADDMAGDRVRRGYSEAEIRAMRRDGASSGARHQNYQLARAEAMATDDELARAEEVARPSIGIEELAGEAVEDNRNVAEMADEVELLAELDLETELGGPVNVGHPATTVTGFAAELAETMGLLENEPRYVVFRATPRHDCPRCGLQGLTLWEVDGACVGGCVPEVQDLTDEEARRAEQVLAAAVHVGIVRGGEWEMDAQESDPESEPTGFASGFTEEDLQMMRSEAGLPIAEDDLETLGLPAAATAA